MKKQTLFLLLILAVPVIIFLFLKGFGRNEFDVPVYYASGVPSDTLDCQYSAEAPFRVNVPLKNNGTTVILLDGGESLIPNADRNNLIRRIQQNGPANTNIVVYFNKESGAPIPLEDVQYIPKSDGSWKELLCGFITNESKQLIVIDDERRIRGYYGLDLDEIDRLLVELEIIVL